MTAHDDPTGVPASKAEAEEAIRNGARLRELRKAADMSLQQVADLMGWKSRSNMSKIELGQRTITTAAYKKLLSILGAPNPANAEAVVQGLRDIVRDPNMSLRVWGVSSSGLEPDMRAGDHVMVDTKVHRITREGVYLIQPKTGEPELLRGRRHPVTDRIVLTSGRPESGLSGLNLDLSDDQVDVLGRVVWTMRRVG